MHGVLEHLNSRPKLGQFVAATLILLVVACEEQLPPVACGSISSLTISEGERSTMTACFADPNGDVLSYTASSANPGVATASNAGKTITVTAVSPGNTSVTVTASNPNGMMGKQSFQVTVRGGTGGSPDLLFTAVTPRSATVYPGDTAWAEFTVANSGTQPSDSTLARLFQSADTIITTSDTGWGVLTALGPLDPAEEVSFWVGVIVPLGFPPGILYMGVCLDVVPGETNVDNNCSPAFTITVTATSTLSVCDAGSESAGDGLVVFLLYEPRKDGPFGPQRRNDLDRFEHELTSRTP